MNTPPDIYVSSTPQTIGLGRIICNLKSEIEGNWNKIVMNGVKN